MVCVGVLGGFLLFALLSLEIRGGEGEDVDLKTLANIIKELEMKVKPLPVPKTNSDKGNTIPSHPRAASVPSRTRDNELELAVQYAVVVAVPKKQCTTPQRNIEFLKKEDMQKIQKDLNQASLHEGKQLIAAKGKGNKHSEWRLLISVSDKNQEIPLQTLLNNNPDSCVIFYTYNSPCLDICLNPKPDEDNVGYYNAQMKKVAGGWSKKQKNGEAAVQPKEPVKKCILDSLKSLGGNESPKAFVFNQVYREDKCKAELGEKLKEVSDRIPLYRCNPTCKPCKSDDDNIPINPLCTA